MRQASDRAHTVGDAIDSRGSSTPDPSTSAAAIVDQVSSAAKREELLRSPKKLAQTKEPEVMTSVLTKKKA